MTRFGLPADTARWSLALRLTMILVGSLTLLALLLGIGGAWYIGSVAERTSDRLLRASLQSIVESVGVEGGQVTLTIPAGAFGMLEDNATDNVYYQVTHGRTLLTGYPDLPAAPVAGLTPDSTSFRYDVYKDQRVRIATEIKQIPRVTDPVVVQVAETLGERHSLRSYMLLGLVGLEAVLVGFTALMLRPAVRLGLAPVTDLRRELETRPSDHADFTPLGTSVPAEVRGLVEAFNTVLGQLERSVANIRQFMVDASHQICTPLAIIRTNVAVVLRDKAKVEDAAMWLKEADHAADRLSQLVAQLTALSRAEDPSLTLALDFQEIDLGEHVADLCREVAPLAIARDIDIHFETDGNDHHVLTDRIALSEMVLNVLDNAIRYGRQGGQVGGQVWREGDHVMVRITDDGPGIPEDQMEMAFRRFHRLKRDQNVSGSGLGLPIVKALADSLNARLTAGPGEGGRGLSMTFDFPAAHASQGATKRVRQRS